MKKILMLGLLMLCSRTALAAELEVQDAWVRLVPPVSYASAAYMTLKNDGDTDRRIIGVTCDVAASSGLHGMRMQDGRMVMFVVESVVVPAHGTFSLSQGGAHIMLMGLKKPLKTGNELDVVLYLEDGGSLRVKVPVRDARQGAHGHM